MIVKIIHVRRKGKRVRLPLRVHCTKYKIQFNINNVKITDILLINLTEYCLILHITQKPIFVFIIVHHGNKFNNYDSLL